MQISRVFHFLCLHSREQHRISKVDELMALCHRLEIARAELQFQEDQFMAASHHQFPNENTNIDAYCNHAQFFIDILRKADRPDQPNNSRNHSEPRGRGMVVPQDPNDESTPESLEADSG